MERLLTPREAGVLLGYTPESLRDPRVRRRLGLPVVRLGRRLRFRSADLFRLMGTDVDHSRTAPRPE